MSGYYWISQQYPSDPTRFARLVEPRSDYTYDHFYTPKPILDPPSIVWCWSVEEDPMDWCPATSVARLFSPRMAKVIRRNLGPQDRVQWISSSIRLPDGSLCPREIPHFLHQPNLANGRDNKWLLTGQVTDQLLVRDRLEGLNFVGRVNAAGSIVVSVSMLDALLGAKLTGIVVKPARIDDVT